jgi:hypothetical protein
VRWLVSLLFCVFFLAVVPNASGATISGHITDTSGAIVLRVRIEILGGSLAEPAVLTPDKQGHFATVDLPAGIYSLRIILEGFETQTRAVELGTSDVTVDVRLSIATARQKITVTGKTAQFANTDPVYRQLRNIGLGITAPIENFTLEYDVASFHFTEGTLTWLTPVQGRVTGAIFIGNGHFTQKPFTGVDRDELFRRTGSRQVDEDFGEAVFRFTGDAQRKFLAGAKGEVPTPPAALGVLQHWQEQVRHRHEIAEGFSDTLLGGDDMENVDAEILAAIYNRERPPFFRAYIHGKKHKDLRFVFNAHGGAIPQLGSPEEIALINHDPAAMDDGIWYLAHRIPEYVARTASSLEEKRDVTARQFKIETVIGNNNHLTSVATIRFASLTQGERVIRFELLPNLRVTRVTGTDANDLYFIQESRKADGSFYVILPTSLEKGAEYSVTVEYAGDKVIVQAGIGSFYVRARQAWYPNLNHFSDRAQYDLTYKVPKKYKVISVGSLDKEWIEGNFAASHWTTPKPVVVAGFNFGDYRRLELTDDSTHYRLSGYFLPELPDTLAQFRSSALSGMAPGSMTRYVLDQTRAQLQLCTYYFGHTDFDQIYITEQPDFDFGQSWPNLVYLPISAYIDSTQRWMLAGNIDTSLDAFVAEVTPHEVAHQWWGRTVSWASYHDQWLSEGFAEFSAALFLQQAQVKDWHKEYTKFWDRLRRRILEKNQFGVAPNDAGPLWLGQRLVAPRSMNAYQNVTYPKGAFVLGMLQSLLYSNQDRDKAFIAMMHDFVDTHRDSPASTESFKTVVEKHMTKSIDLQGNGRPRLVLWRMGVWNGDTALSIRPSTLAGGKRQNQTPYVDYTERSWPGFRDAHSGIWRFWQRDDPSGSTAHHLQHDKNIRCGDSSSAQEGCA